MTEFTIPIPECPPCPIDFVVPDFPIPDKIVIDWGTVQTAKEQTVTEQPEIKSNHFTVESELFDIMPHVQSVKYKYRPKQIFLTLHDTAIPGEQSLIFKYLHDLTHLNLGDLITVTTCDKKGNPIYEHKFLGCELIDHECPMNYSDSTLLKHSLVFRYNSVQFKNF